MLTGKCKEDFEKWIISEIYYLGKETLSDLFMNALYIEFFDSVGFHIKIYPHLGAGQIVYYPSFIYLDERHFENERNVVFDNGELYYTTSRLDAKNEAIKKANEIYNHLNKD